MLGATALPRIAFTVGQPTMSSRRGCSAAQTIASAATSGWKIGGTGCGSRGIRERAQVNCGVFSAGSCTIVTRTFEPSCKSSARSDSRKPCSACLAPQYGACSGMPAVGERGADLNDRPAVARSHTPERRHRPPDRAEVRDLGRAAELVGLDLRDRREDRRHRVVDPDVDRPELLLHAPAASSTRSWSATSAWIASARPPSSSTSRDAPSSPARPRARRPMLAPRRANARTVARRRPPRRP